MKKEKRRSPFQKFISLFITVVCLSVFVYAAYGLIDAFLDYYKNRKVLHNVQEIYYDSSDRNTVSAHKKADDSSTIRSGFDELLKHNDDVTGWITIDNTNIDYPILQSNNNTDYLRTGFYGDYAIAGSLFLDYRNDISTSSAQNYVVYGHRVKDGSMFEDLTKYLDEDFLTANNLFTFDTLYESYDAEIFAVYNTMIDFNYIQTDFMSDEEYKNLLTEIQTRSIYETDVEVSADDQIITLSTCEYTLHPDDSRLVIHAKLTKK